MTHHPGPDQKPPITSPFTTRPERFELPTFGSVDRRSIQLSYGRKAADSSFKPERRRLARRTGFRSERR